MRPVDCAARVFNEGVKEIADVVRAAVVALEHRVVDDIPVDRLARQREFEFGERALAVDVCQALVRIVRLCVE
jgi:hypothetical protein